MQDLRFPRESWKPVILFASFASVSLITTFLASPRNRKRAIEWFKISHPGILLRTKTIPREVLSPQNVRPPATSVQRMGSVDSSLDLDFITDDVTSEQFTSFLPFAMRNRGYLTVRTASRALAVWIPDFSAEPTLYQVLNQNTQFYGEEGQKKVHDAMVVVIGLGGVGSHAATMLLRAGIAKVRLIDFDQVSLSSLNRHAVATRADVGTPKALCLQKHFKEIFPECEVDARVEMFDSSTAEDILSGSPDFILDCIDNIETKTALLAECVRKGLKVLSATGAGGRADPTRIRIADISESSVDPLSRSVRSRLRRDHNIVSGIPVVFSTEHPKVKLLPFTPPDGKEANPLDYQVVPGFRVRTIPVLGTIPAIFGQVMASYVITTIAGMAVQTEPVLNLDVDHYALLHQRLVEREELLFGTASEVELDKEEVAYVVREIWRGRSARSQGSRKVGRGMWNAMKTLTLTRWDVTKPPSIDNLVLLTFTEAEEHEAISLGILKTEEPEFYQMVEEKLSLARREFDR